MSETDIVRLKEAVEAGKSPTLSSVFPRISFEKSKDFPSSIGLAPCQLDVSYIVNGKKPISESALQNDLARLNKLHPDSQTETFTFLLQKYGWRIAEPSVDGGKMPDVAICDSIRVKHALKKAGENGDYLLVKGDLSGIQNYIYGGIQPKDAGGQAKLSKRLRGRSILVSMLTDFLANVMLYELGFSNWQLLFAGGGHFNLILPFSKKLEIEIDILAEKIDREMSRAFGDTLDLVVVSERCGADVAQNATPFFERINAKREAKKFRQHSKSLHSHFYPDKTLSPKEKNEEKEKRDQLAENLGTRLPKRNLILETVSSEEISPQNHALGVFHFDLDKAHHQLFLADDPGKNVEWCTEKEWKKVETLLFSNNGNVQSARVFSMNNTDIFPNETEWGSQLNLPVSFGFRFLGKYVPTVEVLNPKTDELETRPQTFEELSEPDHDVEKPLTDKNGLLMLASMRLDVDDLGCIFSNGFQGNASLSQVVALSREMHYFFTAHFDQLAAKPEHRLYVVYSGGDDAFVVGRWDKIIAFSRQLQKDFHQFVQKNKDVHFSAGIFVGDPKYPVERFHRDAKRLQDDAKNSNFNKNRMNVFDRIIEWPSFDSKIKFGEDLFEILKKPEVKGKQKLTMAFMYRVLQLVKTSFHEKSGLDEQGQKFKRGYVDMNRFGRNIAGMRYLFARHGYTEDEITKIETGIEHQLTTDFLSTFNFGNNLKASKEKADRVQDFLVAFNYALFSLRIHKKLDSKNG